MGNTSIEWTDKTWNPVTGCSVVSPGCDNCYAESIAKRFAGTPQFPNGFQVTLRPERLEQPLKWRKPSMVFVNSMSDLFHDDIPDSYIARVWMTMFFAPQHTFQILTKRAGRMRSWVQRWTSGEIPHPETGMRPPSRVVLPNVWLGVSAEDQKWANVRIPALLDTPAAVRFVSAEPLLGSIDMRMWLEDDPEKYDVPRLDWVIVGGESGPKSRAMHPDWARSLRDQCTSAGVSYLFKQWGEWAPNGSYRKDTGTPQSSSREHVFEDGGQDGFIPVMARVGKKQAGRLLDGRTWDEFPVAAT
jgi:protein gp37